MLIIIVLFRQAKKKECFKINIKLLRAKYPTSKLGFRERKILNGKGSRVSKAKEFPGCYKVSSKGMYFVFTHGKSGYSDFTVVM